MHQTKALIIRTVKYGETSLVVTAFTQKFGLQTYMVNGVRTAKKTGSKAAMFQPAALLDLQVYHNERNSMHRIREQSWLFLFQNVLTDVVKNSIALFMMELLNKMLKQPEPDEELFEFCEDVLIQLDAADKTAAANFPLFIILHLSHFFGFRIDDNFSKVNHILDLNDGRFVAERPPHPHFAEDEDAAVTAEILRTMQPAELADIKLNKLQRRQLLQRYVEYYSLHMNDFGGLKTLKVMGEIF